MAPYDGALFQLTSNESTDSVRTQLGLSVTDYFLYHLNVIKRRYFIWNKKA